MGQSQSAASKARALLRGPTTLTTFTNAAILAGNALAGAVSARALGPAGRGQLAIVVLWSALISMVGSLGLLSSCSYHVAIWPDRRSALAAWVRRIAARQAIAMTIVSAAIMWWLHIRLRVAPILTIEYTTWAGFAVITVYGVSYLRGLGDFARFNLMRAIPGAIPAVLMLGNAMALDLTPAEAGAAYLVPTCFSAILAYAWLPRRTAEVQIRPLSRAERRSVWSYGWRSLGSFSGLALNSNGDQLALGILVPVGSLGLYSVAASASSPLASMVASLGMVGLPAVAGQVGQAKAMATWKIMRRAIFLLVIVSPAIAALLPWAIPLVYGARYATAVIPAEILLVGGAFTALASVTDELLRAHGHPGFVCITQGVGGCITVTGTVLLGGRPLPAVAFVSSFGFAMTFILAIVRLRRATYSIRSDSTLHIARPTSCRLARKGRITIPLYLAWRTLPETSAVYHGAHVLNRRKVFRIRRLINPGSSGGKHRLPGGSAGNGQHRHGTRRARFSSPNLYT
jgi:O-antigen/teichoic acid export membrane protein